MLEKIKDSCNYVMDNAEFVTINYAQLNKFIKTIDCKDLKHWLSNNPYNILDLGIENVINFMLLFESIAYSFWGTPKWTIGTNLGEKDGADALLYAMLKFVKDRKLEDLYNISYEEFKLMNNFPSFKDERKYDGKTIYFYKLAQLLTSDILHLREKMENVKVDYSHLVRMCRL